jgi:opacity protein-like surface antigen
MFIQSRSALFLSTVVVFTMSLAGHAAFAQEAAYATAGAPAPAAQPPSDNDEPRTGFYLGVSAGSQGRAIGVDINLGTAAEWSRGFGVSPLLGYRAPGGVRVEFEMSNLDNNNVGFFFPPYPNGPREESAGHVGLRSFMLNAAYDVPLGRFSPGLRRLSPFFAFGLGATESRINGVTSATLQAGIPGIFGPTVLDTASRFTQTWQTRLGSGFEVSDRVEVFGDWRYFKTGLLKFKTIQFPDVQVEGAKINEIEGGIRIFF